MYKRIQELESKQSFFLFGARGTGKSTLLQQQKYLLNSKDSVLWIDLLSPEDEEKYSLKPQTLLHEVEAMKKHLQWIVIDEIQKAPKLLNVVHKIIESTSIQFALTGSSSRKLKRIGANLLAGRAYTFQLFPFTSQEMGKDFNLDEALAWGTLPGSTNASTTKQKALFLKSYYNTYIKEEIVAEQAVRNLNPFRLYLPICMQNEAEPLNFSNISDQTGVDTKTIQNYYDILCDTHLGFFLNPYGKSIRAVQKKAPKFYFFDTGVRRAIEKQLSIPLQKKTSDYGKLFETWYINEVHRYNECKGLDYNFSYIRTKDDAEIDLIIERPDKSVSLVEIKSSEKIEERHLKHLNSFKNDFPNADLICVCNEKKARKVDGVWILPWKESFKVLRL